MSTTTEDLFKRLEDASSKALTDANNAGKVAHTPGIYMQSIKSAGELGQVIMALKQHVEAEVQNSHEAWVALSDHAEKLRAENEALRRGECICKRCGLRQPGKAVGPVPF